jgi:NAD(P)-dependent dehydrogenase (short-subunit alcohol dehydrogenase family)
VDVLVLTGGAGGLGTAIASASRADGYFVVSFDRVAATQADESFILDVADDAAVDAAVGDITKRFGNVHALVCAAGIVAEYPVAHMPLDAWRGVIDASLTGAFVAARAVLPAMIAARSGRIVAFSSGYATSGYRNGANYAAAKAGVEALVKSIALENAQFGITANCVAPGPIDTPMLKPERAAFIAPAIPLGRVGTPADIVGLVRFLLREESSYITGQTIQVNGGLLMR